MKPQIQELFRQEILRTAELSLPQAVTAPILLTMLRPVFRGICEDDIADHARFLVEAGYLKPAPKALSPDARAWHISAEGRHYLAQQGLA